MKTVLILLCSLLLNTAAFAQDCPTKHAALTLLDHASMEAAYAASFRGLYHREPTGVPGSGPDDIGWWITTFDHYGEYSDHVCRAGWNAYAEARLSGVDAGLTAALGDQPARFLPNAIVANPQPVPVVPAPTPVPQPTPSLAVDYSALIQQILNSQSQLLDAQRQLLLVAQDTNVQVKQINSTVGQTVAKVSKFLGTYVAPAALTYWLTKRLTQ